MTRIELRTEGYDFYCYNLLCEAVKAKEKYSKEHSCHLVTEVISSKFTVYFLGIKKLLILSRKERGCYAR